jgi:sigma-B regulation protein RsbQ
MDPAVAAVFARTTFLSDTRDVLPRVSVPTLVLQCSDDVIAPTAVGRYVAESIPDAHLVQMQAVGHCPNLSDPEETIEAIRSYLGLVTT